MLNTLLCATFEEKIREYNIQLRLGLGFLCINPFGNFGQKHIFGYNFSYHDPLAVVEGLIERYG
mgnify:CR=1 FL=1